MNIVFYIRNMSDGAYICDANGNKMGFFYIEEARKFIAINRLNPDIYTIVGENRK